MASRARRCCSGAMSWSLIPRSSAPGSGAAITGGDRTNSRVLVHFHLRRQGVGRLQVLRAEGFELPVTVFLNCPGEDAVYQVTRCEVMSPRPYIGLPCVPACRLAGAGEMRLRKGRSRLRRRRALLTLERPSLAKLIAAKQSLAGSSQRVRRQPRVGIGVGAASHGMVSSGGITTRVVPPRRGVFRFSATCPGHRIARVLGLGPRTGAAARMRLIGARSTRCCC